MGTAIPVGLVEEGPLDVNAFNETPNERIALTKRSDGRQPPAHRVEIVGDDRGEDAAYAVGLEPLARPMQRVGLEAVLIEIHPAIAVDLEIEELPSHWPPRPPLAMASSSSFVQGRVRPAVAARTSFTVSGLTAGAAFPHWRRMNVNAPAICSSLSVAPSGGIRPTDPSFPCSRM